MFEEINQIKEKAIQEISQSTDLISLNNLEKKYLGRKGLIRQILKKIVNLSKNEKVKFGQLINQTKLEIKEEIEKRKKEIEKFKPEVEEIIDITLPAEKKYFGHLHPLTNFKNKIIEIFQSMGFEIVEGEEVDNDWYNFEALNIPVEHPARDIWDTFYINSKFKSQNSKLLLRTHTSNMQVRMMEKRKPPFKICVIGKCFRHEATDATHEHTLYQIEGFAVDKRISLANLIYTLKSFLNALYKKEVEVRIRPGYFPFVEPGIEFDMKCENCKGEGCSVCKNSGWIEILGAGMIHPKVFESAGYPKGKYTGFAFGVGLDRLVMMYHKIDDIRWFHSGDLRFIKQF
jgi:phenylalanyl-tRNA synthetase alpha chain